MTDKANKTKKEFSKEKLDSIKNKRIKTNLEKWGVENVSYSPIIINKIKTNLPESIKISNEKKTISNIESSGFDIVNIKDNFEFELICKKCNLNFEIKRY